MSEQRNGLSLRGRAYHYERRVQGVLRSWSLTKWLRGRGDARVVQHWREAKIIAGEIDAAILDGTVDTVAPAPAPAGSAAPLFGEVCDRFVAHLQATEIASWTNQRGMLRKLTQRPEPGAPALPSDYTPGEHLAIRAGTLGALPIDAVSGERIEAAYQATRSAARGTRKKYKQTILRCFTWAVRRGHLATSPITDDLALPTQKELHRTQRVAAPLLAALLGAAREGRTDAAARLAALIEAAVETGCRKGELLAIRYRDLDYEMPAIRVTATEPGARKTGKRLVPFTERLQAIIAALPGPPNGGPWAPSAYVFGNEIGEKIGDIRKAWDTCVLRAHHHEPIWTKQGGSLAAPSRAVLAAVNVHFHDLRHEAALRWHEAGIELNAIAQLLGHADLSLLRVYLAIQDDDAIAAHLRAATAPMTANAPGNDGKTTANRKNLRLVGRRGTA